MLLTMTGELDDEQRALQIATNTNESKAWSLALRGTAETFRGNDHEAVELYRKGLEIKPKDIVLTGLLAINYATAGDFRKYFEASGLSPFPPPTPPVLRAQRCSSAS